MRPERPGGVCRLYGRGSAAQLVLQDIFCTVQASQARGAVWQLFADALTASIAPAKWQYLLLLYACLEVEAPNGMFGVAELHGVLQRVYPRLPDDELQKLLLGFRDAGLVRYAPRLDGCMCAREARLALQTCTQCAVVHARCVRMATCERYRHCRPRQAPACLRFSSRQCDPATSPTCGDTWPRSAVGTRRRATPWR